MNRHEKAYLKRIVSVLLTLLFLFAGCAAVRHETVDCPDADARYCRNATEAEIAALFDRWNEALQSGDPERVVDQYAEGSLLLPTLSNTPRFTREEKLDYFRHFMAKRPSGRIDLRRIETNGCAAVDAGLYTFTYSGTGEIVSARYTFTYRWDGTRWLITTHHSSLMPENHQPR